MSNKIKLAHVVCVLPPYGGGLGVAAHNQAELMNQAGFDVTVLNPQAGKSDNFKRNYKVDPIRSILKLGHGVFCSNLLYKLFEFDIVHLHFPFFGAAMPVIISKILKSKKQKLVITYHQDLVLSGWRSWHYKILMKIITPMLLSLADKIVVSTFDYVENSLIKDYYFANKAKFIEIPFSVSRKFKPEAKDSQLLQHYGLKSTDFVVLFVGGLDWAHYFKGVEKLIEAFNLIQNKDIKALIVGTGNLKADYEKKVLALNLSNQIKFVGYVGDDDLPKHYNLADVEILPSIEKNEAFGIVLIEAMACGKPVLASDLRGVRMVVRDNVCGYVLKPGNVDDIKEKIELLCKDHGTYQRFSQNCLRVVEEKYRPESISALLTNLYTNL